MSTKSITQQIIPTALKSGNAVLVLIGLGIWWATKMSPEQVTTLRSIVEICDRPIGYIAGVVGGIILVLLIVYSLVLYPIGKFIAKFVFMLAEAQQEQNRQMKEHIEGSKATHNMIGEFRKDVEQSFKDVQSELGKFK